jgi:hypothetical protein
MPNRLCAQFGRRKGPMISISKGLRFRVPFWAGFTGGIPKMPHSRTNTKNLSHRNPNTKNLNLRPAVNVDSPAPPAVPKGWIAGA